MTPHWHEHNPWADKVVYVPLERLAACVAGGTISMGTNGPSVPYDVAFVLKHWSTYCNQLDGYILPQPSGRHSIGIRYGSDGNEYLSPHNAHPELTQALLDEFRSQPAG